MRRITGEWRYFDDALGIPYPWYTGPALEVLNSLNLEGANIFEYGVGKSTDWYRMKGANVHGVDVLKEWADETGCQHEPHYSDYIHAIKKHGIKFDIVAIDGDFRDHCLFASLPYIKPGGIVIMDNWKQPSVQSDWPLTEKVIENRGLNLTVYKEPDHYDWQTAIIRL